MFPRSNATLARSLSPAVELLVPDRCAACDGPVEQAGLGWCEGCLEGLPWLKRDRCSACSAPLARDDLCGMCRAEGRPWSALRSAVGYESPVRELIQRWKFSGDVTLSRALGHVMIRRLVEMERPDGMQVVPVPQAEASWRRRGFSPAIDLARHAQCALESPLIHALERSRGAPAQVGLTAGQRRRNVSRLFHLARRAERKLAGHPVLLVDDVVTTTATAEACATTLRRANVPSIVVVSLARARA